MQIYTAACGGKRLERMKQLGLGVMISASNRWKPGPEIKTFPCAFDNGAFRYWQRGFPFLRDLFWEMLRKTFDAGVSLDFIVCPDIVTHGKESLAYSVQWADTELVTCHNRLALAVQDGMTTQMIDWAMNRFSHIFVGGTVEWKWETAKSWVQYAHDEGKKCHIARCGQLDMLRRAEDYGADSVDSTSFMRNESWHIIEEFYENKTLFSNMALGGG